MLPYDLFIEEVRIPDVPTEKRTMKNLPKYSDGKAKLSFTVWLGLKGQGSKGYDGKFYGWSHRAVYGFASGDTVSGDSMAHVDYNWDDYDNDIKHKPYKIKDDADAKVHALRFAKAVD